MVASTNVISIHKAPLEGSCRITTEGWLYIRYTKLVTNGRPYAHITSIHKGAVALRLRGGSYIISCFKIL